MSERHVQLSNFKQSVHVLNGVGLKVVVHRVYGYKFFTSSNLLVIDFKMCILTI